MHLRPDGRSAGELRTVRLQRGFLPKAEGSCIGEMGRTRVVCTVTVEEKVPGWRRGQGGWLTAEYAMLPRATEDRTPREISRGRPAGRSQEIQRLIGRSLRAAVDLSAIGERTLWVDCDVLEADGGTRTASITGAAVALCDALSWMKERDSSVKRPLSHLVSAVSCGIVGGEAVLDLCYAEDSQAEVDANFVLTDAGEFVEVQATGEGGTLRPEQLQQLLALAEAGTAQLFAAQREALGDVLGKVMRHA